MLHARMPGRGAAAAGTSIWSSTSPRARSRPTARATTRVPPDVPGSTTIACLASLGTANEVVTTQPAGSTIKPDDGPAAGAASAGPPMLASETPAASIRTTAAATRSTAVRKACSSAAATDHSAAGCPIVCRALATDNRQQTTQHISAIQRPLLQIPGRMILMVSSTVQDAAPIHIPQCFPRAPR